MEFLSGQVVGMKKKKRVFFAFFSLFFFHTRHLSAKKFHSKTFLKELKVMKSRYGGYFI
jgi:hypothetical protein